MAGAGSETSSAEFRALTMEHIRADVAEILGAAPADIGDHEDLLDRGVDSIRLMTLVERWRELGLPTTVADLADDPTVAGWTALVATPRS